jgi:choline dehydrogenase-like flavoprotein
MIHDLDRADHRDPDGYDVVVVGSGPAGTTLAVELSDSGLRVAVLESGGTRPTPRGDALKRVASRGLAIKDWSRERVLGGASTTWAGLSSPLDPIDFEDRAIVKHGRWPIPRDELVPYWRRAARYRFPEWERFGREGFARLRDDGALRPTWSSLEEKTFLACAQPQDFGREHRAVYERSERVDLWLHATASAVRGESGRATHLEVRDGAGRAFRFRGRAFVIACGGIENARLLLLSRDFGPAGLGNDRDQVGRCFMNHPKNYYGVLELATPVESLPYWFGCLKDGYAGYGGLKLAESEQRSRGVLNSYVRFEPLFPWSDSRGVESLVLLVKRSTFLFDAWKARRRGEVVELRDYAETGDDSQLQNEKKSLVGWLGVVFAIVFDLRRVLHYAWYRVIAKKKPKVKRVRLRNFMEMEPRPENRVTLGREVDEFGSPLPVVEHDVSELDKRSVIELHRALQREFESAGVGRLLGDLEREPRWPIDQDASHHLGTTRMGDDPASSVVDRDCRIHGVENAYLAGGSVFPTSGCANPTYTIVALSIRLAEHLRARLAAKPEEQR